MPGDGIGYEDLLSFLAVELGEDLTELKRTLLSGSTAPQDAVGLLEERGLFRTEFRLAAPVRDASDGASLLARDVVLSPSYLKALISRQVKCWEHPLGPIRFSPSEPTLEHFRTQIRTRFTALVRKTQTNRNEGPKRIFDLVAASSELRCVQHCFDEILESLLARERAPEVFLPVLPRPGGLSALERSIEAAFLAMAVSVICLGPAEMPAQKERVRPVGLAALLQDLGIITDPSGDSKGHPARSARLAADLGADPVVVRAVEHHHRVCDESGRPALCAPESLSAPERVLTAVNVFLDFMGGAFSGSCFEAIKAITHLAEQKYVDSSAVRALARLYLPKIRAIILERASLIAKSCPRPQGSPILWPITGDKVPTVFLCQLEECEHKTDQITCVAKSVPFLLDGHPLVTVAKGDYFTCPRLTGSLRNLYDMIQAQARRTT
ncbi:MAG: hypothetical protein HZB55_19200 [Deltaproteobacteria bacterium]|nr:hypothetical protein [Deltaproteobacteria bacterium]